MASLLRERERSRHQQQQRNRFPAVRFAALEHPPVLVPDVVPPFVAPEVDVNNNGNRDVAVARQVIPPALPPRIRYDGELSSDLVDSELEMIMKELKESLKFELPSEQDPAPGGSECMMHLVRDVLMLRTHHSDYHDEFRGEIQGRKEILRLKFSLTRAFKSDYVDLKISDHAIQQFPNLPMSLARFSQAEVFFQFFKLNEGQPKTLVYEAPASKRTIRLCMDLPNAQIYRTLFRNSNILGIPEGNQEIFSIYCPAVIPYEKLEEGLSMKNNCRLILMRVYLKLIKGNLDTLYGIQKCFSPEKSLFDLRDTMEDILKDQPSADFYLITGDGQKYFGAHRAVLAANSDVFKAMLAHREMQESKGGQAKMQEFVTSEVLAAFLKYMYSRQILDLQNDPSLTANVLRLAHYYQMQGLVDACEECLLEMPLESFNLEITLNIFYLGELTGLMAIQTKCVHIIMRMKIKFSANENYLDFARRYPDVAAKITEMISQFRVASSP